MGKTYAIQNFEHVWIPLPDGVRLAARIWRPKAAQPAKFPALLEIIPYRKRDMVRARDERNHPVFAAHGYVCLRVDMRGSGDSEGCMPDMYTADELADTRQVIEWIAQQPWCNGKVGMFGTSWGGTASLQASVDAPKPLKAVIANCATIDRFDDDIHWMGGCVLTDTIEWGATLPAILAAPPDAATVGDEWRAIWQDRLDQLTFALENWLKHQQRGDYWRHGSVRFQTEQISCPILAIGGWSDRYSNNVMPLIDARPDLCWGIAGPWGHHYPDQGEPGPAMDFQALALQWWDHWLKDDGPSELNWPRLQFWQRTFDPPQDRLAERQGQWLKLSAAKPDSCTRFYLADDQQLTDNPASGPAAHAIPFDPAHGHCAGDTGYFGRVGGLPLDQTPDDALALCFEAPVVAEPIDLIGHAVLELTITRQSAKAQLVARLCDVAPDNCSNLITRTIVNLALVGTGEVTLEFPTTAYRLQPGHRLRLALAGSYWPLVLPVSDDPKVQLAGDACLILPTAKEAETSDAPAPPPETRSNPTWQALARPPLERQPSMLKDGVWSSSWHQPRTSTRFHETGTDFHFETTARYEISAEEPVTTRCKVDHLLAFDRPDGTIEVRSVAAVTAHRDGRSANCSLTVTFAGQLIATFEREFSG